MSTIKKLFLDYTSLPSDIINLILSYVKCCQCNNMTKDTCIYCNECYCKDCYSPFYGVCCCPRCSHLLF